MTTQPTMFGYSSTRARQNKLFNDDGPRESGLSCQCGEPMVRTPGGYLCCARGHGKLHEQCNDPRHWDGDDADLFTTEEE